MTSLLACTVPYNVEINAQAASHYQVDLYKVSAARCHKHRVVHRHKLLMNTTVVMLPAVTCIVTQGVSHSQTHLQCCRMV